MCPRGGGARANPSLFLRNAAMWSRAVHRALPSTVTQAASAQGERGPACSTAHPAGCQGPNPTSTCDSLLFSARVPSGAKLPSFPRPLASVVSSWRVYPERLLPLGSGSLFPAPLPGSHVGHLPNIGLESAWSLILGVADIMIHVRF